MIPPVTRPGRSLRVALPAGLALLLVGFASLVWTPYPPEAIDISAALGDPNVAHWLGTDQLGRDVVSLIMRSLLTSFVVSGVAVAIGAIGGFLLGIGSIRWQALDLARRALDRFFLGFPGILLAMLLVAALGPGGGVLMLALGFIGIPAFADTTQTVLRRILVLDFVALAHLSGLSTAETWRRHVLPDLLRALGATASGLLGTFVLLEAAISFIGLGAQPPASSFGLMLRDAQSMALAKPLLVIGPGLCLLVLATLAGMASRGLWRLVDPRLREVR